MKLNPGETYRTKKSKDLEQLLIIKEGLLSLTKGAESEIGKGSTVWIVPGDEFVITNTQSTPASFYMLTYKSRSIGPNVSKDGISFIVNWDSISAKPTDKGERREFFDRPTPTFERVEMHVTTLNKKDEVSHAPHTHRSEEIIVLIKGQVEMTIGEEHVKADPGAIVFLGSQVSHALKNIGDTPCTYFAFQWQLTK